MTTNGELLAAALLGGRYRDAARLLNSVERSQENSVLVLEAAYYLAHGEEVLREGERLLRVPDLPLRFAARCARLVALQLCDDGRVPEGIARFRVALSKAAAAGDEGEVCLARTHLLERACDYDSFDGSLPLAAESRRAALRSGDPQVRAAVHNVFGRLEGRAGRYELARRHFEVARGLLLDSPNLRLSAALDNDDATLLALSGEFDRAFLLAQRSAKTAAESGYSKGTVTAACTKAYILAAQNKTEDALDELRSAADQPFRSTKYDFVAAETRALVAFQLGHYDEAHESLSAVKPGPEAGVRWYEVERDITRCRMMLRLKSWVEVVKCAEAALKRSSVSGTQCLSLRLLRAEAQIGLGNLSSDIGVLYAAQQHSWPITLLAHFWTVVGKAFAASGDRARGRQYRIRAVRALQKVGATAAAMDAARGIADSSEEELASSRAASQSLDVDSVLALLDLADYPLLLGEEAFRILDQAQATSGVVLTALSPKGTRPLQERRPDVRESSTTAISILVGEVDGERIELQARPRNELEADHLLGAIQKTLAIAADLHRYRRAEKQRAALWPVDAMDQEGETVWVSEQMSEVLRIARRIAPTPLSVLLTGETGTGKEMLAREIHRASDRAERPFLPFNCSAVPRDMVESQLFGYRKGAFTGADAAFPGVIRSAAGGTLFLDEIADVPLDVQPKLLRFLETREIHPLGESQPTQVDVRIVAATNANLEHLVAAGRFREDLFYRLNVVRLTLPPLRERREEIPALVQHYLRKYGDEQKKGQLALADETLEYLLLYGWPGNVRQLANEVRRMVALVEPDSTLTPAALSPELQASRRTIPAAAAAAAQGEPEIRLRLDQPLPLAVEMLEQTMIRSALKRSRGRVEEAAKLLGISRKGLFLKRRRWNLDQKQAS
jgi:DNA-binding NtrC family response regulator/tetratricopeptide (TPR) repeat protein